MCVRYVLVSFSRPLCVFVDACCVCHMLSSVYRLFSLHLPIIVFLLLSILQFGLCGALSESPYAVQSDHWLTDRCATLPPAADWQHYSFGPRCCSLLGRGRRWLSWSRWQSCDEDVRNIIYWQVDTLKNKLLGVLKFITLTIITSTL